MSFILFKKVYSPDKIGLNPKWMEVGQFVDDVLSSEQIGSLYGGGDYMLLEDKLFGDIVRVTLKQTYEFVEVK